MNIWKFCFLLLVVVSCAKNTEQNSDKKSDIEDAEDIKIEYASGFQIKKLNGYYLLKITEPWPKAEKSFTYLLQYNNNSPKIDIEFDYKIKIPIEKLVVTSTTHIPSLDTLGVLNKLIGFPNTNYISTKAARKLINDGKIKDVGQNESLNTELLLEMNPDAVVTFAVKGQNKGVESIKQAGIPVLYNADWVESNPLGKAEWIKFFGLLFDKTEEADRIFTGIKNEYENAKKLVANVASKPNVLSGALWKDNWYLPSGESWQAKILDDAHANYLYEDTKGSGSLSLSFESVLDKGQNADFWIAPAQYTSYVEMLEQQSHYNKFKSYQNKNIYSFSSVTGENGGVLYYELAPNRPDLVLKDLINIFHPDLLPDYKNHFFKPLEP
jgi:iron complex transport system substrate-binding protein